MARCWPFSGPIRADRASGEWTSVPATPVASVRLVVRLVYRRRCAGLPDFRCIRGVAVNEKLIEVKTDLYRKYTRMAGQTKSQPRRKNLLNKARCYAQQIGKLGGKL